ncbi:hypothetical protein ACFONL_21085, partial [Camelimonas fluminis]
MAHGADSPDVRALHLRHGGRGKRAAPLVACTSGFENGRKGRLVGNGFVSAIERLEICRPVWRNGVSSVRLSHDEVCMPVVRRSGLLALVLTLPVGAVAQNAQTFTAANGSYSFQYPQGFSLSHMFADGTGDVTGVTASTMNNGDVVITFLGPRDPGDITGVSEQSRQAIVDEFTKSIAVLPSIRLKSSTMTTMLGQPAVDMVFTNKRFKNVAINRYVFTVRDGKAYNFECIYREDKPDQFVPACDLAVSYQGLLPLTHAGFCWERGR